MMIYKIFIMNNIYIFLNKLVCINWFSKTAL